MDTNSEKTRADLRRVYLVLALLMALLTLVFLMRGMWGLEGLILVGATFFSGFLFLEAWAVKRQKVSDALAIVAS